MKICVQTKSDEFAFSCDPEETLLAAGLSAGFSLPYECSTGTCGTCHARVMQGTVEAGWSEAPGLGKLHPDKGDVLMCQARPLSDCVLRVRLSTPQPKEPVARLLRRTGQVDVVHPLTHDVIHFEVALSSRMSFDAGQFVGVRSPGFPGRRAYSMVNYGHDLDRLSFVVKRKPKGQFSDFLFDGEILGKQLDIMGPVGRATFRPEEARDLICIAGGSGIAGMMSILEHARKVSYFQNHRGRVFFGVRTLADAFYLKEFADHLTSAKGGLDVTIAVSHEQVASAFHPQYPGVQVAHGMVHEVVSSNMAGQWGDMIGFVAGPQPMVDAALRILITEGALRSDSIRYDKFT